MVAFVADYNPEDNSDTCNVQQWDQERIQYNLGGHSESVDRPLGQEMVLLVQKPLPQKRREATAAEAAKAEAKQGRKRAANRCRASSCVAAGHSPGPANARP